MAPTAGAADASVEDPGAARFIQCWYELQQALEETLRDRVTYHAECERMCGMEMETSRIRASYDHDAEAWARERSDFIEHDESDLIRKKRSPYRRTLRLIGRTSRRRSAWLGR